MDKTENRFLNKLIFGKYKINKRIGKGSNSIIFSGININNQELVALKIQEKSLLNENIEKEAYYLLQLKGYGIPKIISFGYFGKYNILIEELLGKSLEDLFKQNKNKEKSIILKDMIMTGIQLIDRIEYIHSKNILHLDIKPNNFLVGYKDPSLIYIIDFGLSKKYRSSRTGRHISFSKRKYFSGNLKYSSVNNLKGIISSRRDDLESLGYMLIYLYKNILPWDNIEAISKAEIANKLFYIKTLIPVNILCKDLPKEMTEFMIYTKSLKFDEKPNYSYMRNLFEIMLKKLSNANDLKFSWINEDFNRRITPIKNIKKRKSSPYVRILNNLNKRCSSERNTTKKQNLLNNFDIFSDEKEKKNLSNNPSKMLNECINKNINENNKSEKNIIIKEGTNINISSKKCKIIKIKNYEYKSKINFDKRDIHINMNYISNNLNTNSPKSPRNGNIRQNNYKFKNKIPFRKISFKKNINISNKNATINKNLIRKYSFNRFNTNQQIFISNFNTINNDNSKDINNLFYNCYKSQNPQQNLNNQNFNSNLNKNLLINVKVRNINDI